MTERAQVQRMNSLAEIDLHGFRTIRALEGFRLDRLNILIGPNGAGKSNLISFFQMLSWMTKSSAGELQIYVAKNGYASAILHDGAETTPQITANLSFETQEGTNEYRFRLTHAAGDTLIFAEERYRSSRRGRTTPVDWISLGAGHREAQLGAAAQRRSNQATNTPRFVLGLLRRCVVHQFHNTSKTARLRQPWDVEDGRYLKEDGGNLAAFLLHLRGQEPECYARIVETIRQVAPFLDDFVLEPKAGSVLLQWRERGTDRVFGAHQASDGTLRLMAIVALLLQPEKTLPELLIIDEPELGLHPYAIRIVAGLLRAVSHRSQVLVATQSIPFLDEFRPEEIVVVDRPDRESTFRRLDPARLEEWLEAYSLGELWEKNVLGGRPTG